MFTPLTAAQVTSDLAIRDLTDPTGGPHSLQQLIEDATSTLRDCWGCAVRVAPGPRVVPLADNYDRLRFPPEAITRDARYTRYVDDGHMLRSHASAMVPPALRGFAADPAHDVVLACRGSPTAGTSSTASMPVPLTNSTCGASPSAGWEKTIWRG